MSDQTRAAASERRRPQSRSTSTRAMSTMPRRSRSLGDRAVARMASIAPSCASSSSAGGPDLETALRTTGILVSRRSTQGQNGPRLETVDDRRQQRNFRRTIASWLLNAGRKPRGGVFCLNVHNGQWRTYRQEGMVIYQGVPEAAPEALGAPGAEEGRLGLGDPHGRSLSGKASRCPVPAVSRERSPGNV